MVHSLFMYANAFILLVGDSSNSGHLLMLCKDLMVTNSLDAVYILYTN